MIYTRTAGRPRTGSYLIIGATLASILLFLAGFGIWYQFIRDDAPPPVSLSGAVSSLNDATPTTSTSAVATATTAPTISSGATAAATESDAGSTPSDTASEPTAESATSGLTGEWLIDTSQETFVGYRVGEELAGIGTTEAVGRTSSVTGTATVDGLTVTAASFEADLTTLESDDSMRDGQLGRQGIETDTFPTATFVLNQPIALDGAIENGEAIQVTAIGDLTLHGVTNTVEIPLDVQLSNGVIVAVGSLEIQFADYNVEPPSSMKVLAIDDHGTLELQLFFTR